MDLEFNGSQFTWHGIRNGTLVDERLDRGRTNKLWQDSWPNTSVIHGTVLGSDHCPVIIQGEPCGGRGKSLFRFEAFWSCELKCRNIVKNCWEKVCMGDNIGRWNKKINVCRYMLARWSKRKLSIGGSRLRRWCSSWGNFKRIGEKIASRLLIYLTKWTRFGARKKVFGYKDLEWNGYKRGMLTRLFFHQSTLHRRRRRRNKVLKIKDANDVWIECPWKVRETIDSYFVNLFTLVGAREWGSILDCVTPRVTAKMNASPVAPVTVDEIKFAAMQMEELKAPGPDGFQGIFYHSFWENVEGRLMW